MLDFTVKPQGDPLIVAYEWQLCTKHIVHFRVTEIPSPTEPQEVISFTFGFLENPCPTFLIQPCRGWINVSFTIP